MNLNFLALYSDHLLILIVLIILAAKAMGKISGTQTLFCLANGLFAWLLGMAIKTVFWYPRPYLTSGLAPLTNPLSDGSFPSNHATLAFTLSLSVYLFHRRLGLLLFILALLVSAGRVIALVHTRLDICGAFLLSLLLVLASRKIIYPKFSN